MNPVHADFSSPRLWEAESSGDELHEPLKSGSKTLTTIKEVPLPEISLNQKIAFGILCAKEVCKDKGWNLWADKWLSGEDRTTESAKVAYNASYAAYYAASYAAYYIAAAASYASYATYSAKTASYAAYVNATYSAKTASYAADANKNINFDKIAEKSMKY